MAATRRESSRLPRVIPNDSKSLLKPLLAVYDILLFGSGSNSTIHILRNWLRSCEKRHCRHKFPNCRPLDEDGRGIPILLIDVEKCCLVPFQPGMRYMALSYVWGIGESAGTKTEKSNLQYLLQTGSLLGDTALVRTPKTVEDAMILTGLLGVQYLWCDRFCIVQDDMGGKQDQIAQMAEIYARAYCTIVAYDSEDSNSGLHGLKLLSGSIKRRRRFGRKEQPTTTKWSTRGWTFQEYLFSTRCIKFGTAEIKYHCRVTQAMSPDYAEYSSLKPDIGPFVMPLRPRAPMGSYLSPLSGFTVGAGLTFPIFPCFDFYQGFIEDYTHRSFTSSEDVIHAFSGAAKVLEIAYPGGFFQGLPAIHFPDCLLWQPDDNLFERRMSETMGKSKPASWSWMGWKGIITWHEPYQNAIPHRRPNRDYSVEWFVSEHLDGASVPIISNDLISEFLRWADTTIEEPLPAGWTRNGDDGSGGQYYQHDDIRHHGGQAFWQSERSSKVNFGFPFPLASNLKASPPQSFTLEPVNYIHGKVRTGKFEFGLSKAISADRKSGALKTIVWAIASVETHRQVGLMMCPANCEDPKPGDSLAVIGISTSSFHIPAWNEKPVNQYEWHEHRVLLENGKQDDSDDDWFLQIDDQKYRPGDKYEFANVMWIQPGKPAYRRGLGRIEISAFIRECCVEEFVSLG